MGKQHPKTGSAAIYQVACDHYCDTTIITRLQPKTGLAEVTMLVEMEEEVTTTEEDGLIGVTTLVEEGSKTLGVPLVFSLQL